jgi:hypothetical protein
MVTLDGGVTGNRRGAGRARVVLGVARVGTATGEDGTVGRGVGRLTDECDLIEDARDPCAGNEKPVLVAGAEGGAWTRVPSLRSNGGGGIAPNDARVAVGGGILPKDILDAGAEGGGGNGGNELTEIAKLADRLCFIPALPGGGSSLGAVSAKLVTNLAEGLASSSVVVRALVPVSSPKTSSMVF